ncbi:hypothetical protein HT136_24780 [Novosphingobium profundi]|uniref:hypothetical protein n=1 Tax=Novosphingobium profundi TaxID=1774954 RepID=UPI001BDAC958|nr:hypothetical protein [Novosphingobium profundi]MBT0671590.1 hypothetical protein [Novosphingobium profundi]
MDVANRPDNHRGLMTLGQVLDRINTTLEVRPSLCEHETSTDRGLWAISVYRSLDLLSPSNRPSRAAILKTLRYFARRGSITAPVARSTWRRIYELACYCAHDPDWISANGPIMGASNATLEDLWGVQNPRRILRELARWGFIVPHQPKANGHRSYKRTKKGPQGSGWSLAALLVLHECLEEMRVEEERQRELFRQLPRAIAGTMRACISKLGAMPEDDIDRRSYESRIASLRHELASHARHDLERLLTHRAESLELEDAITKSLEAYASTSNAHTVSTQTDENVHLQYKRESRNPVSSGSAENAVSPDMVCIVAGERTNGPHADIDPYGIKTCGFTWSEAKHLFPFQADLIDLGNVPDHEKAPALARLVGVKRSELASAELSLGSIPTALCVMIAGQMQADGMLQKPASAYLRGMVAKARTNSLNLGHTVFARRKMMQPRYPATN